MQVPEGQATTSVGSAGEVFGAFLKLGLTSFGGPIAHLGYFREELVRKRQWVNDSTYAELVALCQFLPGPTSSQLGFALGLTRAGWLGGLAAFTAFTLPSAVLLFLFAMSAASFDGSLGTGALRGLKIVAVPIIAHAVIGMATSLCPDRERATIAVAAVAVLAFMPGPFAMVTAIMLGALSGLVLRRGAGSQAKTHVGLPVTSRTAAIALATFFGLLVLLPLITGFDQALAVLDSFYRAGALVFGGGHVVLPLLEAETVASGWLSRDQFLAGYGAAQAVPGPLFAFAAYLGALLGPAPNGFTGAVLALFALFLPGFLLLVGVLPFRDRLRSMPRAQSMMQGANAAVVGVLGAALYSPVFTSAIGDLRDLALALACFLLLAIWKAPSWQVVAIAAMGGIGLAWLG